MLERSGTEKKSSRKKKNTGKGQSPYTANTVFMKWSLDYFLLFFFLILNDSLLVISRWIYISIIIANFSAAFVESQYINWACIYASYRSIVITNHSFQLPWSDLNGSRNHDYYSQNSRNCCEILLSVLTVDRQTVLKIGEFWDFLR